MPLYIKSPINSQCNLSTVAAIRSCILASMSSSDDGLQKERDAPVPVEVSPLPTFARVRCGRRRALEILLKNPTADPLTPGIGQLEANCPKSNTALIQSKVSVSTLKGLVTEVNPTTTSEVKPRWPQKRNGTSQILLRRVKVPEASKVPKTTSVQQMSPPRRLHPLNPFADHERVDKEAIREAVALLQASANALFQKMELHPETLKQIVEWQTSASQIPDEKESAQCLLGSNEVPVPKDPVTTPPAVKWDFANPKLKLHTRPSRSSYFPNISSSIPGRRAYKYKDGSASREFDERATATVTPSTPKFLLGIRESLSNISMVPFVSSTCDSVLSSPRDSSPSDFAESDISDIQITYERKHRKKKLGDQTSLPAIRSQMKKLMRTLSDMNAVPEVMDIFIDSLPPVVKITSDQLQRLNSRGAPHLQNQKQVKVDRIQPTKPGTVDELPSDGVGDEKVKAEADHKPLESIPVTPSSRVLRADRIQPSPGFTLRPMTVTGTGVGIARVGLPRRSGSSHVNAVASSMSKSVLNPKNPLVKKKSASAKPHRVQSPNKC